MQSIDAVGYVYECPDITGSMPKMIKCVVNRATEWKRDAQTKEDMVNQVQGRKVSYEDLGTGIDIEKCGLKCTGQANTAQSAGCCEYRVDGRSCHWTGDDSYLAPEVRELNISNSEFNTRAVLCFKGSRSKLY